MGDKAPMEGGEKGPSAGFLAVIFLVWVGICAVFFSLGFVVGYNEQSSKVEPVAERVTPSTIPPILSSSDPDSKSRPEQAATTTPVTSRARVSRPAESAESNPPTPSASAPGHQTESSTGYDGGETGATAAGPANEAQSAGQASREVRMGFTVQVDALRAKQDAEALVKILKARRYPVFLVTPGYSNSRDNLFRVQVGPFTSREDAERVRTRLEQEGFKPFIKR